MQVRPNCLDHTKSERLWFGFVQYAGEKATYIAVRKLHFCCLHAEKVAVPYKLRNVDDDISVVEVKMRKAKSYINCNQKF